MQQDHALLMPPNFRRTSNDATVVTDLVNAACFVAHGAGPFLERLPESVMPSVLGGLVVDAFKAHQKKVAERQLWFVVSAWLASKRLWAVVAFDREPRTGPEAARLISQAQRRLVRSHSARRNRRCTALLVTAHDNQLGSKIRCFPRLEEALTALQRVHVLCQGGPLETTWETFHPRSRTGFAICRALQGRQGEELTITILSQMCRCSEDTVRRVVAELVSVDAPLRVVHGAPARVSYLPE